jgi:hypothetical protein
MQSHVEVQESVQEMAEGAASQKEGSAEPLIKNGPENCSSHEEDPKDEILVKVQSTLYRNIICSDVFHIFFAWLLHDHFTVETHISA